MYESFLAPLESIDPPTQAIRQHIPEDLIEELATSIQAVGLIEPIVVVRQGDRLRILAGHRRFLACRRAGLLQVPVVVRDADGVAVEAVQVQENIIRQDMSPAEEARLFDRIYQEEGQDIEKTAGRVRLSVSYVDGRLRLLEGDQLVLEALDAGDITLGVANALNRIKREDYRRVALDTAVRGGATIAVVTRWVADYNNLGALQGGEATPQTPAADAAPYSPMAASVSCWFCEGSENLDKLRMVQVHDHCVDAMNALLKRLGRD